MNADPQQAKALFLEAVEKHAPDQWPAFLDEACAGQPELRRRMELLLEAHREAGTAAHQAGNESALPRDIGDPTRPDNIGPYKLLEQIGEGGMGTVWMAQQTEPVKRVVALKLIKAGMDSKQVIARFEAERQALALMDHVNIARVLDAGTTSGGRPYFVMDLVKGVPITRYCDEHHLTPRQRLELFIPVCQAVQHAHQKGIIHRDLKPSNVLVALYDGKPVPKVIDFGVAKATGQSLTDKTLVTGFGNIVGTLEYMSPEQAEINQLDIDTRSDVYSLGVLLYELLAGSPPFSRKDLEKAGMLEILRVIREQEPSKPSTKLSTAEGLPTLAANRGTDPARLMKQVRGELDWIVMKALEKDRNRRYETANGFALDVQRYLADEPVQAGPPSAWYRLRKFARRNTKGLVTAAAFAAMLVAGVVLSIVLALRALNAEELALDRLDAVEKANAKTGAALKDVKVERDNARTKADEALRNLKTADAVYRYLIHDLFAAADPELSLGRKVTVLEVVNKAAAKVDGAFPEQPLVEATIQHTLGTTYIQLGVYRRAEPFLRRALELRERHLGEADERTLDTMASLGVLLERMGKQQDGLRLAETMLARARARLGPDAPLTLTALFHCGVALRDLGRHDEAAEALDQAFKGRQRIFGDTHLKTLQVMGTLCTLMSRRGRDQEALRLHEETYDKARKALGPDHPGTTVEQFNLANQLRVVGRLAESRKHLEEVVATRNKVEGVDHPRTINATAELSFVVALQGQWAEGRKKLEEALAREIEAVGEDHPYTLRAMHNLAAVLGWMGREVEAEKHLRKAIALWTKMRGPDNINTLDLRMDLGAVLANQGRLAEARKEQEDTLERLQRTVGWSHKSTTQTLASLALTLMNDGQADAALPLAEKALALRRSADARNNLDIAAASVVVGEVHQQLKRFRPARQHFEEALTLYRKAHGETHAESLKVLRLIAEVSVSEAGTDAAKLAEALKSFADMVRRHEEALGGDHRHSLNARQAFARALFAARDLGAAVERNAAALADYTRVLGPAHLETMSVRDFQAVLVGQSGKWLEARALCEENLKLSENAWGADHPSTRYAVGRLALVINMWAVVDGWRKGRHREGLDGVSEAVAILEPVVERYPGDKKNALALAQISSNLAVFCITCPDPELRNFKEALRRAQQAVKLGPDERMIWLVLGEAHYRNGNLDDAEKAIQESMRRWKGKGNALDWFVLALIEGKRGRLEEARRWHQQAVLQMEAGLRSPMLNRLRADVEELLRGKEKPVPK